MNKKPINPILQCENIAKEFSEGPQKVTVLEGINLSIFPGERVAILGASGSGKSTLLHLLGGLDTPTQGKVRVENKVFSEMNDVLRAKIRNRLFGFVYQFHHLLPEFTALENVAMPLLLREGIARKEIEHKAMAMLEKVGLSTRVHHKPSELSGGERQRVAIARALIGEPKCVLADEPTGNLDSLTAGKVMELFLNLNEQMNTTFIIVTHDINIANKMGKQLYLENGRLN